MALNRQQKRDDSLVLSLHIEAQLGKPSDVFYAVREVNKQLVKGYWYRLFTDETKTQWYRFGYAGATPTEVKSCVKRMRQNGKN